VLFTATKKGKRINFFSLLFFVFAGSGIRYPGSGMEKIQIRDRENIPVTQHWLHAWLLLAKIVGGIFVKIYTLL
jgi:hypothetical protein